MKKMFVMILAVAMLMTTVAAFAEGTAQADDITVLAIRNSRNPDLPDGKTPESVSPAAGEKSGRTDVTFPSDSGIEFERRPGNGRQTIPN